MEHYTHVHGITPDDVHVSTHERELTGEEAVVVEFASRLRIHGDRKTMIAVLVRALKLLHGINADHRGGIVVGPNDTVYPVATTTPFNVTGLATKFDTTIPYASPEIEMEQVNIAPPPPDPDVKVGDRIRVNGFGGVPVTVEVKSVHNGIWQGDVVDETESATERPSQEEIDQVNRQNRFWAEHPEGIGNDWGPEYLGDPSADRERPDPVGENYGPDR